MIKEVLGLVFIYSKLYEVENDESKLKKVYKKVKDEILPFFNPKYHIDFTGRLFNVLNAWVKVPDGSQNDVVLTPRYVCELMTKLCQVNENSYVWDYATGSAGFLISAMKEMIKKANTIADPNVRNKKIMKIKAEQLLGVEKLPDIYMLAVLNMLLMGDGSSNIIHKNSLTEYNGTYEMGDHNGEPFPADVFLLNPPYSADGKGFVFVEKALNRMKKGKAAALTAITGAPTVLGAILGLFLGTMGPSMLSLSLSFASGAMLYVVFGELIPEAILMWQSKLPALATVIGILTGLVIIYA